MFVLEYRHDEARRTTFGSLFGTRRSRQGSHCHVATSPRRDVIKSRRGGQQMQKSTIHHVATSSRRDVITSRRHHVATSPSRDVTTSRRQLKNLHLIIKCERAREFRVLKNVRPEIRNLRTCNTDFKHLLGFLYWFFFIVLIIFGSHEDILHITYFVSFLHDVLSLFLGLHQTLS